MNKTNDGLVDGIVRKVRERYGKIAEAKTSSCCGPATSCCGPSAEGVARELGYAEEELRNVPEESNLGLGCGAPLQHLGLRTGEVVLDLGSGAGFDAFLAARSVGPEGRVIGVDMTPEMIARANANRDRAGLSHVEFRLGRLEALPVDDASVDAATSNCVINLVPDKGQVFREVARVLRVGGRVVVSDIVLDGDLPDALAKDLLAYVGCVAGAMRREPYFEAVEAAGLARIEVVRDVDFLAAMGNVLPDELAELSRRTGVRPEEVQGIVRSVTFRAIRP